MAVMANALPTVLPDPPAWSGDPVDLVDLERYPLLQPEGPMMAAVVAGARGELGRTGAAALEWFRK